jgi:hypothetical protein
MVWMNFMQIDANSQINIFQAPRPPPPSLISWHPEPKPPKPEDFLPSYSIQTCTVFAQEPVVLIGNFLLWSVMISLLAGIFPPGDQFSSGPALHARFPKSQSRFCAIRIVYWSPDQYWVTDFKVIFLIIDLH